MPDIVTSKTFVDGEKGITAAKLNQIISGSVIQPSFYNSKASSPTLDPTDILLELKGTGSYAQITGSQLISSVGAGLSVTTTFISKSSAYTLTPTDNNKYIICSGGSWVLTLPSPAVGLNFRVRNDQGISGTTGTITLQTAGGTIDGLVSMPLLPQQECQILSDGVNWRTFGRQRCVILGTIDITSSTASGTILLPVGYRDFEIVFKDFIPATNRDFLVGQFSTDGGTTWKNTNYYEGIIFDNSATAVVYQVNANTTVITISDVANTTGPYGSLSIMKLSPGSASINPSYIVNTEGYDSTAGRIRQNLITGMIAGPAFVNALKFNAAAGNITNLSVTIKGFA